MADSDEVDFDFTVPKLQLLHQNVQQILTGDTREDKIIM